MSQPKLSFAVYEPRRLSEQEFLAGFVARTDLADFLLAQLRRLNESEPARHRLIIGQRGMGKTSLLRRIAIGAEIDPDLRERYASLTFREEQYNVRSIDQFWRNCGEAFAEWLERLGYEEAAEQLDRELTDNIWRQPGGAEEAFLDLAARWGKRPVLLVDNLDLILSGIPVDQHWSLRNVLQRPGGPVLYGASVSFMQTFGSNEAAFYEFFSVDRLEPLGEQELMLCLQRMAERRGNAGKPVLEILAREPQRLKVLHTLTGGNPRILVLIYYLLERVESDSVFSDLESLLDQLTPFYKAKIEEIHTGQPRAILDAIALNWDPIASRLISSITGIEITTISSQLNRLKNDGFIEEVETSGARAGYQVAERFFNIWYLMRHGTRRTRQKMRWLTIFLKNFYSYAELEQLHYEVSAGKSISRWKSDYEEAISNALDLSMSERHSGKNNLSQENETTTVEPSLISASAKRRVRKKGKTELENEFDLGVKAYQARNFQKSISHFKAAVLMSPINADLHYSLGVALNRNGNSEEAESSLRRAIELDSTKFDAYRDLGSMIARQNRAEEAKDLLLRATEINPSDPVSNLHLGNVYSALEDNISAEKYYRISIEHNKKPAIAYANLGKLLFEEKRYEEAIDALKTAVDLRPSNTSYWALLGSAYLKIGDRSQATITYRSAIDANPKDVGMRVRLADILVDLENFEEADSILDAALNLDPHNPRVHSSLGMRLAKSGQLEDALSAFDAAVKFNPDSAIGHANLALCLYQLGYLERAEKEIRRAIEIQPGNKNLNNRLAAFLMESGGHKEAIEILKSCIDTDPDDDYTNYNLGMAYSQVGDLDLAEGYLKKYISLDDKDPSRYATLGKFLLHNRNFAQAIDAFTSATLLDGRDPDNFANLGVSLLEVGKIDEAIEAFQTSMEIGSDDNLLYSNFGVALVRKGKIEEAEDLFRKAIALDVSEAAPFTNLSLLLANQGRAEEALDVLRQAIASGLKEASILKMLGYIQTTEFDAYEDAHASFVAATEIDPIDADAWNMLGANLLDYKGDVNGAKQAFAKALELSTGSNAKVSTEIRINLGWSYLDLDNTAEALEIAANLPNSNPDGVALLRAGIELKNNNLGNALEIVGEILAHDDGQQPTLFEEGIIRFFKSAYKSDYGEKIITWFEDKSFSDKHAPLYAAFVSFVRGERHLLDVSPEVRRLATKIYSWLAGPKQDTKKKSVVRRPRRNNKKQ